MILKKITQKELNKIISLHKSWINFEGGKRANLSNYDLRGLSFKSVYLNTINFKNSDLRGTNFINVDLYNCNFANCLLNNSNLICANFEMCNFANADISDCNISWSNFDGSIFFNTQFDEIKINHWLMIIDEEKGIKKYIEELICSDWDIMSINNKIKDTMIQCNYLKKPKKYTLELISIKNFLNKPDTPLKAIYNFKFISLDDDECFIIKAKKQESLNPDTIIKLEKIQIITKK